MKTGSQEHSRNGTVSERPLTCVVDELRVAVFRDYRVLKIQEFYEYDVAH